jgi:hypothetical protein
MLEQHADLQRDALVAAGCGRVFTDHVSGHGVRSRSVPAPPEKWACGVAGSYLTLRLERAARQNGVELIDPARPLLPPMGWHERRDPGRRAAGLAS